MSIDIQSWMKTYCEAVLGAFGSRVAFIGLQGSYGRNEAAADSDIDVVLLLDSLEMRDLEIYRTVIANLYHRDKICGFVGGKNELEGWEKSDLFSFCFDTEPLYGSLDSYRMRIKKDDVERCVLTGACTVYHSCSHNYLHERSGSILRSLQKSAFFVMRAKRFLETGTFVKRRAELLRQICGEEQEILTADADIETLSGKLLSWSGRLISEYGRKKIN